MGVRDGLRHAMRVGSSLMECIMVGSVVALWAALVLIVGVVVSMALNTGSWLMW